jgi:hypothetical protein
LRLWCEPCCRHSIKTNEKMKTDQNANHARHPNRTPPHGCLLPKIFKTMINPNLSSIGKT